MSPDRDSAPRDAPARSKMRRVADVAATLAIAGAGGVAFWALGLPAGWLVGAMVATSVAALAGVARPIPTRLRDPIFVLLGVSMGSAVTPATLAGVAEWPGSMAALAVAVVAMTASSYAILRRGFGWDRITSFYASPPGALGATLVMAATSDADMRKVAVVQVFRVFVLVAVTPIAVTASGAHLPAPTPAAAPDILELIGLVVAAAVAGALAQRLRFPGGALIGAFFMSAALHGSGVVSARLPDAIATPCFVALGAIVGTRFAGLAVADLVRLMRASVTSFATVAILAVGFALAVGWTLGLPSAQVFVAFAPGGLEAMMLMAYLLGLDPAYVGAHHVARFIALSVGVPIVAKLVTSAARRAPQD